MSASIARRFNGLATTPSAGASRIQLTVIAGPEFARAARWREKGKQVLAVELSRQIYDDGSFVQHSTNYHRLMLHDVIWAIATARAANDELPPAVFDRAKRALEWLRQMTDPQTGGVPNYGYNDGALILPLTCCDYTEFRPAAQTLSLMLHGQRAYPAEDQTSNEVAIRTDWRTGEDLFLILDAARPDGVRQVRRLPQRRHLPVRVRRCGHSPLHGARLPPIRESSRSNAALIVSDSVIVSPTMLAFAMSMILRSACATSSSADCVRS